VALARKKIGKDWKGRTPNLVMGSNVQVVWEKFCRYFDVEPALLADGGRSLRHHARAGAGQHRRGHHRRGGDPRHTFTGELEPIAEICAALDKLAASGGCDIPVHVDAASGGFVVPFLTPRPGVGFPAAAGGYRSTSAGTSTA